MVVPYFTKLPRGGQRQYGGVPNPGQLVKGGRYLYMYKSRTYKTARLVREAFHGPPPEDKPYCLHIDENALNNRSENLKWGTQKENLNAPGFLDYCRARTGANNPVIKGRAAKAACS